MPPTAIRSSLNLLVEAETQYDQYFFHSAISAYKHHLATFSHPHAKLLFNISCILLALGSPSGAIEYLRKAIKADPHLAVANYQLAGLLLREQHHWGDSSNGSSNSSNSISSSRESAEAAYANALQSMCGGDTDYESVGMKFTLEIAAVKRGLRFCRGVSDTLGPSPPSSSSSSSLLGALVPAGVIFRVVDRKARARTLDVAKTAEWRFRRDVRVLAVAEEEGEEGDSDGRRRRRARGLFGRLFRKKSGVGS